MEDCIFCKIVRGEMDADIVYSDDQVLAFRDINPQAPVHILVIPKRHLRSAMDLAEEDASLLSHIFHVIQEISSREDIAAKGVRILTNVEKGAGQSVLHLHFHILGGRRMLWPPG